MNKAVVVFSGGMDSTTLLYKVKAEGSEPYPITFKYGQRHSKEIVCAVDIAANLGLVHKLVDISFFGKIAPSSLTSNIEVPKGHYAEESMKSTVVPNRNMVFLSIAASYAIGLGTELLYYGAHSGDHAIYPDCRPEFIAAMKTVLYRCDYNPPKLTVPFMLDSKADILRLGLILKVPYEKTWSCYEGRARACGRCGACSERLEAFEKNGIKDPLEYEE